MALAARCRYDFLSHGYWDMGLGWQYDTSEADLAANLRADLRPGDNIAIDQEQSGWFISSRLVMPLVPRWQAYCEGRYLASELLDGSQTIYPRDGASLRQDLEDGERRQWRLSIGLQARF